MIWMRNAHWYVRRFDFKKWGKKQPNVKKQLSNIKKKIMHNRTPRRFFFCKSKIHRSLSKRRNKYQMPDMPPSPPSPIIISPAPASPPSIFRCPGIRTDSNISCFFFTPVHLIWRWRELITVLGHFT